jgi:hypothetical protein
MEIYKEVPPGSLSIDHMQDGDVAITTDFDSDPDYIGKVVQRYGNHLVRLGFASGKSWENFFAKDHSKNSITVRILPSGTLLKV